MSFKMHLLIAIMVCKLQKNKADAENLNRDSDLKDITDHPHEVLYEGQITNIKLLLGWLFIRETHTSHWYKTFVLLGKSNTAVVIEIGHQLYNSQFLLA